MKEETKKKKKKQKTLSGFSRIFVVVVATDLSGFVWIKLIVFI
jgi:cytoskeletal protein RodZ